VETYGDRALAALGDPTRRAIFESLARGPKAVGQLARELPVSRPAVSQHLRVLKEAGLVTDRAAGTRRIYQISRQGVQAIHAYLDQMWSEALQGFRAAAEQIAANDQDDSREMEQLNQQMLDPVRHAVTVPLPIERAFSVFTEGFDTWWPRTHKIGGGPRRGRA